MRTLTQWLVAIAITLAGAAHAGSSIDDTLSALQHGWAAAYYSTPKPDKNAAFAALQRQADAAVQAHPNRAEVLIWHAIVLSSAAKFDGGLGALSLAKRARKELEQAEALDARALDGSVYTSLGSLYANVPGWPIGFGDKDKAAGYLRKALAINPDGIDPNFFYGELLAARGEKSAAKSYLQKALAAPARPGRDDADAGRRQEVEAALAALR